MSDYPNKDSKEKSTAPLSSNAQDPVYAMISRPTSHLRSSKDYKNQQLGPLPDFVTLSEDIFGVLEEHRMSSEQLGTYPEVEKDESETVYSEVKNYDGYGSKNEAVDNAHDCAYFSDPHLPNLPVCSDLKAMGEEDQLDMSMEQLSIHHTCYLYGAESKNSRVIDEYDFVSNDESVDIVEDQEHLYQPFASETHFEIDPSNLQDYQDEGFSTYDNLPKRL